ACVMSVPGRFRIGKEDGGGFAWQHDESCPRFSHVIGGVFPSQCRHKATNSIPKVPDQAGLVVIDGAEFHFGFEIAPAFARKSVTRKKSAKSRCDKQRHCYVNDCR